VNVDAYLHRLDYHGAREPSAATLSALHTAHLLAVPFENLDISLGRPILLDQSAFYAKIVERRRGGFCYELNGLFATLLHALGFDVTLLSARVHTPSGLTPEFDHLALIVRLDQPWLADVGFGDCFYRPLPLAAGEYHQPDRYRAYRLSVDGNDWRLEESVADQPWEPVYNFAVVPRRLADFSERCQWLQTAPASHFTQSRVCSRATPTGRVTLRDHRLITTDGDQRNEQDLPTAADVQAALREHFGITGLHLDRVPGPAVS
jgi:N-hydroxyarylamine O-acetyltransferase